MDPTSAEQAKSLPETRPKSPRDLRTSSTGAAEQSEAATRNRPRNGTNAEPLGLNTSRRGSLNARNGQKDIAETDAANDEGEPSYRLSRVQKIVKMDSKLP